MHVFGASRRGSWSPDKHACREVKAEDGPGITECWWVVCASAFKCRAKRELAGVGLDSKPSSKRWKLSRPSQAGLCMFAISTDGIRRKRAEQWSKRRAGHQLGRSLCPPGNTSSPVHPAPGFLPASLFCSFPHPQLRAQCSARGRASESGVVVLEVRQRTRLRSFCTPVDVGWKDNGDLLCRVNSGPWSRSSAALHSPSRTGKLQPGARPLAHRSILLHIQTHRKGVGLLRAPAV